MKEKSKLKAWGITIATIVTAILLVLVIIGIIYVNDYYHTDVNLVASFAKSDNVEISVMDDGSLVYMPEEARAGLIFFPGGKVEYDAYQPLMLLCAERGIACMLVKTTLNLSIFDGNKAQGIQEEFSGIEKWYIGGHSLGGVTACSYAEKHADDFEGIVLLASYSSDDLSETELEVLSIYGSCDKVLDKEKYEDSKENLPSEGTYEYIIEGGNHAYFGAYGKQEGDGEAQITNRAQIEITANYISSFILDN